MVDGRVVGVLEKLARVFNADVLLRGEALASMLLSALPGLGHLASGRRRAALVASFPWLLLLFLTVNFYSGLVGGLFVGLLVCWHATVIFDAGRIQQHTQGIGQRVRVMLVVLLATAIPYLLLDRLARAYVDFVVSPVAYAALDIQEGDTLLAWRGTYELQDLSVGELVVIDTRSRGYVRIGPHTLAARGGTRFGRILALAGDKVTASRSEIRVNGVVVSGDELPSGRIPMPSGLFSFTVPEGRLLVPLPFMAHSVASALIRELWEDFFLVRPADVRAKIAGVYLPIGRRHYFSGRKTATATRQAAMLPSRRPRICCELPERMVWQ